MTQGGCLLTVTFYGSEKVVEEYNLMGPVKAALESTVRYMAAELGPKRIRVHALSPGPLKTRAASGIERFDELLERARSRTPEHQLVSIEDVGNVAAFLVSDACRGPDRQHRIHRRRLSHFGLKPLLRPVVRRPQMDRIENRTFDELQAG